METPAGRGGKIIRVTNLSNAGKGTLREAIKTEGPRIIVFEVAGVIDLNMTDLIVRNPFVTIAGQTAPSPGITLIKGSLWIQTHDVLIQHIHIRPGDAGRPKNSGWEPDGITTVGGNAYNIVIDHCSVTWSVDENISTSGERTLGPDKTSHMVTISNCINAEALSRSTHSKGEHSKGTLVHDFCTDIAVIGNFYAHNVDRNPYFKAHTTGVIINNLIYNTKRAIILNWVEEEWSNAAIRPENCNVTIIGNVLVYGPGYVGPEGMIGKKGNAYIEDNIILENIGKSERFPVITYGDVKILKEKPSMPQGLIPMPSKDVIDYIVKNAGARPKDRDEIDSRIIREFLEHKGKVINSQDEVGGYPKINPVYKKLEIPEQNIDQWLREMIKKVEY
ncbi:MAG: right-handed parallel beta-helix repeat-containing protein [Spirochaetes bacterium]|nr:right-handed parallel beta-helix repeat-containing protein [Spirochaetota bacterium]